MIRASVGVGTGRHGVSNRRSVTTTGAVAGHQGVNDDVGAALGEPGGFASQLRDGGRIAARAVGLNFGAKRVERATRAVGEDLEAWRAETNAGGEVFAARGGAEAGVAAVLRPRRHGRAGAAERDRRPRRQGREVVQLVRHPEAAASSAPPRPPRPIAGPTRPSCGSSGCSRPTAAPVPPSTRRLPNSASAASSSPSRASHPHASLLSAWRTGTSPVAHPLCNFRLPATWPP